jgi:asparagine synthase (glutamine-hydrolysing)
MCGILGASGEERNALQTAARSIAHRGPDATAYSFSPVFSLAHHRLAIIDLDERSTQPFVNDDASVRLVFNGEIYNYRELKAELEHDYTFRTESDTEVILRGYEKWGIDVVTRLKGMFAIAIHDSTKGVIHLARDHAGIKPLYYIVRNNTLVFASEVKAISTYYKEKHSPLSVNEHAISLFLAFGYIPAHQTLLEGVVSLPPSTHATFTIATGAFEMTPFSVRTTITPQGQLKELIEDRILKHLIADVPVGLFFSGGIDSSLIAAVLAKHGVNLATWSIGLPGKKGDREAFTAIAKELGIRAHVAEFGPQELDSQFEEVMSRVDEPLADNSLLPTYFVSSLAAKDVKIVLSGEGGDEYFLGYERMKKLANMKKSSAGSSVLDTLFTQSPDFKGKNKAFMDMFAHTGNAASYYLLSMSPARNLLPKEIWNDARTLVAESASLPVDYDRSLYLEYDLLRKTDMATMFTSIEGRVPLLDPDVIASALAVSAQERMEGGMPKSILKKILASYISPELVYRPKSGFGMDLKHFWNESKVLRPALQEAEVYLSSQGITLPLDKNWERYSERYPNLCFGLITLSRALQNVT